MNNRYKEIVSEALLRQAVIDDHMNELNAIPSNEELAKLYTFSERHELRMKKLFAASKRKERMIYWGRFAKRVVAAIFIATTILFASLMTVPTIRAATSEIIMEWFEKFTKYSYNSNSPEIKVTDWFFGYVPDGYTLNENYDVGDISYVIFTNELLDEIIFLYSPAESTSQGVDNEHSNFSTIYNSGIEYHIYEAVSTEYPNKIVWIQDDYAMNLSGYCSIDDLLRMIQSLQK